ncbi:MAG: dihydrodipicolinate reductase [Burkholderiales bacterium]|jgi:4-hydroxy-tetrahydrodipicolinate reductase|nr:dihydrodipicolinate reductase [Burkholderiales bacterium]
MTKKIRAGLWGFGRAGKAVAGELLAHQDFDLQWVIKKHPPRTIRYASQAFHREEDKAPVYCEKDLSSDFYKNFPVDIIIDFSDAGSYKRYAEAVQSGIKIISAISNLSEPALATLKLHAQHTAILYSPNITVGINFLMIASSLFQKIVPHADIEIVEEHFREKEDTSGTALKIAKSLGLDNHKHVNSIRVGGIVGKHEVIFGLKNQTIRLVHESINKAAFGQGAIFAAKWLIDQPAGFYTMEEILMERMRQQLSLMETHVAT